MMEMRLLVLRFLLASIATTPSHATPIELNPVTPVGELCVLDHLNPAYGGPASVDMVKPVVFQDPTWSRAFVVDLIRGQVSVNVNVSVTTSTKENETGIAPRRRRQLEASSPDLAKLEAFFNEPMIVNLATLQASYQTGQYTPSPWPSSYWPTFQDGINVQWAGNEPSAAEKYARAFNLNVKQFMNAVSARTGVDSQASPSSECTSDRDCKIFNDESIVCAKRAGQTKGYCIPNWNGICHAWSAAAILEPEPTCDVVYNDVVFHPFDLKALLSQVYDDARVQSVFTGVRYNGAGSSIDEYGRYTDAEERDIGPGFFHIAVANIMGRHGKSLIVDIAADAQVWNQPVRSYEIQQVDIMSPNDAASKYFNVAVYPFNSNAMSVAYVHMVFNYINELVQDGPTVSNGIVDSVTVHKNYYYLLELDANGDIMGGEWLQKSQQDHPDFLWFPATKPAADLVTSVGLSYKNVLDLLKQSTACSPTTTPPLESASSTSTPSPSPTISRSTLSPPESHGWAAGGPFCGNDELGPLPCPGTQYCQPWNPLYYQCRTVPAECEKPEVGVAIAGNDLATVHVPLADLCCAQCRATAGCKAYTFVSYNFDGNNYCYLKTGSGSKQASKYAISATIA